MGQLILSTFSLLLISTSIFCNVNLDIREEMFNIYKGIAVTQKHITMSNVTRENVTLHMYRTYSEPNEAIINDTSLGILRDTKGYIVFITHGWLDYGGRQWLLDLKDSFLDTYPDSAVITVDWKDPAHQVYYVSSINVFDIGNIIADTVAGLVENQGLNIKQFILVGHSLGAQTSGFAGKRLKKLGHKLSRIVALDPAGPLFDGRPIDKRLNPTDAEVVEVIHSDGGTFGFKPACGTIDFFPNGGESQPGCARIDFLDATSAENPLWCDHERSYRYFIEAVRNPKDYLVGRNCSQWNFLKKICDPNVTVAMGDMTATLTGKFYLETNKEKPYNKKEVKEALGLFDRVGRVSTLISGKWNSIFQRKENGEEEKA